MPRTGRTLQYHHDPEVGTRDREKFSIYGLIACIAAVVTIGFLMILATGAMSRATPLLLLAIFCSASTAILGTAIALLDRRQSPTYAIVALILTCTTIALVSSILNVGIGGGLWRWVRRLLF
jgi:hypothetical protein